MTTITTTKETTRDRKMLHKVKSAIRMCEDNLPQEIASLKQRISNKSYQAQYQKDKDKERLDRLVKAHEKNTKKIGEMAKESLELHSKTADYQKKIDIVIRQMCYRISDNMDKVNSENSIELLQFFHREFEKRRITKIKYLSEFVWSVLDYKFYEHYYVRTEKFSNFLKEKNLEVFDKLAFTRLKKFDTLSAIDENAYYMSDLSHYIECMTDFSNGAICEILLKEYIKSYMMFQQSEIFIYEEQFNRIFG